MSADQPAKKLVYILNKIDENESSHFFHILHLLAVLQQMGWVIQLLSEKGGHGTRIIGGIPVTYLSKSNPLVRVISLLRALIAARRNGFRLIFIRISTPAALFCSTVGRLFGFRTFFWSSGALHDTKKNENAVRRLISHLSFRVVVAGVDRFVTGPETMIAYYEEYYRVPVRKLTLLYNDVDLSRFKPVEARNPGSSLRIVSVHRLSPVRETTRYIPSIVEALSRLATPASPIWLDVVGGGPETEEVANLLKAAGPYLQTQMAGDVPNARITEFYSRADVFIMPSRREGMPRVLIEAMAMGLPFVSTDAGGTLDIVGPRQRDFVVSRDDPDAFGQALRNLIERRDEWPALREENLEQAQRYSTPAVAEMYDRVLASRLPA